MAWLFKRGSVYEARWTANGKQHRKSTGIMIADDPRYSATQAKRMAAESRHAQAQSDLGACYHIGSGVEKDFQEAVKWHRKAIERGNAAAHHNFGECYEKGESVSPNLQEAVKWYRKAAEFGVSESKEALQRLGGTAQFA